MSWPKAFSEHRSATKQDAKTAGFDWTVTSAQDDEAKEFSREDSLSGTVFCVSTKESQTKIREIRFKVKYIDLQQEISILGEHYVSAVLHAIFENKRFAISPDGEVYEFGSSQ